MTGNENVIIFPLKIWYRESLLKRDLNIIYSPHHVHISHFITPYDYDEGKAKCEKNENDWKMTRKKAAAYDLINLFILLFKVMAV